MNGLRKALLVAGFCFLFAGGLFFTFQNSVQSSQPETKTLEIKSINKNPPPAPPVFLERKSSSKVNIMEKKTIPPTPPVIVEEGVNNG